jgi:O-antigen/teichoic acid export membrane protein
MVVRISGFEDAGIYSLAISFTNIFKAVSLFGVRNYQISDINKIHTDGTFIAGRVFSCLIVGIVFAISLLFIDFSDYIVGCCAVMFLFKTLESCSDVLFGAMQRFGQYGRIAASNVLKGIFPFGLFCLVLYNKNLFFGIAAMSVGFLVVLLLYDVTSVVCNKEFTGKVIVRDIPKILFKCLPLMLYSFIYPYMTFITRYVVKAVCSDKELGYYSSIAIFIIIIGTLSGAVMNVLIPRFSEYYILGHIKAIYKYVTRAILCIILFGMIVFGLSFALGKYCLVLFFGAEILPYFYLLPITTIVSCVFTIVSFFNVVLISFHIMYRMLIVNAVGALICTLLCYPLVLKFGMIGSCYSLIIGMGVQIIFLVVVSTKVLAEKSL